MTTTIKELRNKYDTEIAFEDLEKAKKYFKPDLTEFPDESEYAEEIDNSETLEELAIVLNRYTDIFGNGSEFYVKEL